MKKILSAILMSVIMCFSPTALKAGNNDQLMVSAAASLRNVMEAAGQLFEKQNPGKKVNFNFASTGVLAQQIIAGAPVDIFLAADIRDFERLKVAPGILMDGFPRELVRNSLCFVVAAHASSVPATMEDLLKPEWKLIAIGSAKTVPAGKYARQALESIAIYDRLQSRYIFCENVRQVLDYVVRGEVDGGFVYTTDAKTADQKKIKAIVKIDEEKHGPIIYGLGKISSGKNPELADRFLEFMHTPECEKIFVEAGFSASKDNAKDNGE